MILNQAIALTIAGADSSGGAGIQADLKTFAAFGVYGLSAITAVTAQNTRGIHALHELPPSLVRDQIECVLDDCRPQAVKIGMLATAEIVECVAQSLHDHRQEHIVLDPVIKSTSGKPLLANEAREVMLAELFPLAEFVTPNIQEAEQLSEMKIKSLQDMKTAAAKLSERGCRWVVIKGGHAEFADSAIDVAFDGKEFHLLHGERLPITDTHGTGCTFSAAIAAALARGQAPLNALHAAKIYTAKAIATGWRPGKGANVPGHFSGLLQSFGG